VQAPLAAHLVLEVLDGVGHEYIVTRNTGLFERAIENPAGRTDERFASQVFLIAGLLAHKHQGAREVAPRPEQPALQIYRAGSARNGLLRREERPAF
jgi:hypothetical protein